MTRRGFLKGAASTATALALPTLIPARARGQQAPSRRVTLAALGVGGRGSAVMHGFMQHADAQFLAVCDPFQSRRAAAKATLDQHYGAETVKAYADYREILARPDIDAVLICTQDHWHVPLAIAAARAGKDMYVEKPLGVSLQWAKALRQEVRRGARVFQYGTQQRSDWKFRYACELARNQVFGKIQRVEAWCASLGGPGGSTTPAAVPPDLDYDLWLGPAPVTPYTADRCTANGTYHIYDYALGFIAGWGAHPLDIAQWGLGSDDTSPVAYAGTGTLPTTGLYDTVASWDVQCRYASGIDLHFMSADVAQPIVTAYRPGCDHGTTFFGENGWVSVDRGRLCASDPRLLKTRLGPDAVHLKASGGQDRDFLDCVLSREATVNPLESAIRSDTISHLADVAIRTGRPLRWDPAKEELIGDATAARRLDRPMRAPYVV
jgi:predicted dehydrogenase